MFYRSAYQRVLNAATALWCEDNGTAINGPVSGMRGTTRTTGVANVNYKNIDDATTAYSSSPITAGNNSYEKFQFVVFTGNFNQVLNLLFNHVSGSFAAGFTLKGAVSGSGCYTTPSTTANANFNRDLTLTGSISTGIAVLVGATGPEATGKNASSVANPTYTQYLATQLQTNSSVPAGDLSSSIVFSLQYDENAAPVKDLWQSNKMKM